VKQEIPHALYVHVEDIEHTERQIRILAYVVVERESQKIIVIGKAGAMIQAIGYESRMRIEEMYEKPVFLQLRVRVEPNWTKNPRTIERLFQQHA
jgi:GTPase